MENLRPLIVPESEYYPCHTGVRCTPSKIKDIYDKFSNCHLLDKLKDSVFYPFFTMGNNFNVQGGVIHNVLLRRIQSEELCFNINGVECPFGPLEFGLITGLSFNKLNVERKDYMSHDRLISKYFHGNSKITVNDLYDAFDKCTEADDVLKLGQCYFIEQVLFGHEETHLVWLDLLHLVEDKNMFDNYPWGVEVYKRTLDGILHFDMTEKETNRCYSGFPVVFQFWAYEIIKDIPEKVATSHGNGFPRMLNWKCNKYVKYSPFKTQMSRHLVVSQMRPRSDVEQKFVESFHDRPSSANSDYAGVDPITTINGMVTSLDTLMTEIESISKTDVASTSKTEMVTRIQDDICQFDPWFRHFLSQMQSNLHHDQHKELTPKAHDVSSSNVHHDDRSHTPKRLSVENESGTDAAGQQVADAVRSRSRKRSSVEKELGTHAAGQQALVAVDQQALETSKVRKRKKGCLKPQMAPKNERNIRWQLTDSQRAKERENEAKNALNLNVDAPAPQQPKSKPSVPRRPKSKRSAPQRTKSKINKHVTPTPIATRRSKRGKNDI